MVRAFAGPLCRYYAKERGDAAAAVAGVQAWRQDLIAALAGRVQEQSLQWSEDPDATGLWTDLGEAGWPALRLFAFYAERTELELPDTVPRLLELDRDYRQAIDEKFERSRYGQLLACSVWLPSEFPITLQAPMPDGQSAEIGSLPILRDQLRWLNERTFQVDESSIADWLSMAAGGGGALLPAALGGYAGLWAAVGAGAESGSPVVVCQESAT